MSESIPDSGTAVGSGAVLGSDFVRVKLIPIVSIIAPTPTITMTSVVDFTNPVNQSPINGIVRLKTAVPVCRSLVLCSTANKDRINKAKVITPPKNKTVFPNVEVDPFPATIAIIPPKTAATRPKKSELSNEFLADISALIFDVRSPTRFSSDRLASTAGGRRTRSSRTITLVASL